MDAVFAYCRFLGGLDGLLQLISAAAASLFGEYEESIARDGNKVLPMDGTIHPITAQVLSYLKVRSLACIALAVWSVHYEQADMCCCSGR